ncbi:hypothetical protein [Herbaspirillum sp. meg3]|nr:hypothetical protein [Herbaspirillum sp. meg3]
MEYEIGSSSVFAAVLPESSTIASVDGSIFWQRQTSAMADEMDYYQ